MANFTCQHAGKVVYVFNKDGVRVDKGLFENIGEKYGIRGFLNQAIISKILSKKEHYFSYSKTFIIDKHKPKMTNSMRKAKNGVLTPFKLIAEEACVSLAMVSRINKGQMSVNSDKAKKVRELIDKYDNQNQQQVDDVLDFIKDKYSIKETNPQIKEMIENIAKLCSILTGK